MQSNDSITPAFPAFPCTERYVALGAIEEAVTRVGRAIEACEPVALVIGPPGTGKSLLCGLIAQQFQDSHQVVRIGETPLADGEALLRQLLHRLKVDPQNAPDPYLALTDVVTSDANDADGLLLIVDEAQCLSTEIIETIRMVTNITRDGQPRVCALLCGGPKLDETLVDTALESFTQRASTRCYLHPLNAEETHQYIQHTITQCGSDPEATITDEAIAAIHHACSGIPRLINQLITQAIDCAADAGETLIGERLIDQAWAQLQQLPSPLLDQPQSRPPSSEIEFGELSDEICPSSPQQGDATTSRLEAPSADVMPEVLTAGPDDVTAVNEARHDTGEDDCADIEFQTTSALWVAEPADPQHLRPSPVAGAGPAGPSPDGLFGEFDQEESIAVGSGFAALPPTYRRTPENLESLLQDEIAVIGNFGAKAATDPAGAGSVPADRESSRDVIQISSAADSADHVPPANDDSDLLIIEDDVMVHPLELPDADSQPQAVAVDFQAMLSKMRGTN